MSSANRSSQPNVCWQSGPTVKQEGLNSIGLYSFFGYFSIVLTAGRFITHYMIYIGNYQQIFSALYNGARILCC